ncbi:NUDIX domain-containing protein [Streptomyces sp. NPDC026092]|uniref:NUDIX domain-containing protein n=1 Tax=Streptomyces sp. NPDC026092 TaxID=3154797 RepID=UPI003400CF26
MSQGDVVPLVMDEAAADACHASWEFDDARAWLEEARRRPMEPLAAEVWVTDPACELVLLVKHRVRGWVPPGGKVEPGEAPRMPAEAWAASCSAAAVIQDSRGSDSVRWPTRCIAAALSTERSRASAGSRSRIARAVAPAPPHRSTTRRASSSPARRARSLLVVSYIDFEPTRPSCWRSTWRTGIRLARPLTSGNGHDSA